MRKVVEENLLRVGTLNLSIEAVKRRPALLKQQIKALMAECDVLLIQEAGAAKNLLASVWSFFEKEYSEETKNLLKQVANEIDVELYHGDEVGAPSDPIMYRSDLVEKRAESFLLTPRTWQGEKGAGAKPWSKPKYLNTLTFKFAGRRITVASIHATPSQYIPIRFQLAYKQVTKATEILSGYRGLKLVGGDWNAVPGNRLFTPLINAGFYSAQALFGPLPTHFGGKRGRAIDDIYLFDSPTRWRVVEAKAVDTTSDHHAFIVTIEVFPG